MAAPSRVLDFETALGDLAAATEALAAQEDADDELMQENASLQGRYQARTGDTEVALVTWNRLLESRPEDVVLHENVVQLLVEEGMQEAALGTLARLVEITRDPAEQVTHRLWSGEILRDAGRDEEALEVYLELLSDVGRDSWLERQALAQMADVDRRRGEIDAFVTKLTELWPDDPTNPLRLVELLHEAARPDEVAAAIEDFLERSGRDLAASMQAARTDQQMNRPDDVLRVARAMVAGDPDDPDRRSALAELLHAQGSRDEAIGIWRTLAREGGAGQVITMARAPRGRGEEDEARAALTERVEAFADDPTYLAALVEASIGGDDAAAALPWGERGVAIAPTPADTLRAVATTARLARRTGALVALAARLEERASLSVGERCLLATAFELTGDRPAADCVLADRSDSGGGTAAGIVEQLRPPRLVTNDLRILHHVRHYPREYDLAARPSPPLMDLPPVDPATIRADVPTTDVRRDLAFWLLLAVVGACIVGILLRRI